MVSQVVDGNTIDVDGLGRVRLADIDCPKVDTDQGLAAKQFTTTWLQDNLVALDIDDRRRTDFSSRLVAVVYMVYPDGSTVNFNMKLVEEGRACIWDFLDNEFNPVDWWNGAIPEGVCIKSDSSASTSASGFTQLGGVSPVGTDIFDSTPLQERNQYSSERSPHPGDTDTEHTYYG